VTRRIYQLIAIGWCLIIMPAAWADDQGSSGDDKTTESVPSAAVKAATVTTQNTASDDERLKVFGFMPSHKPQPASPPDATEDQAAAAAPAPQGVENGEHPAAAPQSPAPVAASQAPAEQAPPATADTNSASAPVPERTAGAGQPDTADIPESSAASPAQPQETAKQGQPAQQGQAEVLGETQQAPIAAHKAVHWSYSGAGAPQFWGDLKPEFGTCGSGKHQSPIDISTATITALPKIQFDYHATPLRVVNNGHSIQVNYQRGSSVVVDGKRYDLMQIHFHTPSEHTMGGKAYPMVAHLVHKAADGELLVIAVLMQAGAGNPLIERIWQQLPSEAGQMKIADEQSINVAGLLPKDATYFTYTGSLTTPPCTEGVKWIVLSAPVTVSEAQVDRFAALFPHNARPVEPLNGRTVLFSN